MAKFKLGGLERFVSTVTGVCARIFGEAPSPPPDEAVGLGIVEPPSSQTWIHFLSLYSIKNVTVLCMWLLYCVLLSLQVFLLFQMLLRCSVFVGKLNFVWEGSNVTSPAVLCMCGW